MGVQLVGKHFFKNMRAICFFIVSLITGLGSANICAGRDWRGVVPLGSTRDDVIRLLGTPKQSTDHAFYYSLRDEIAVIWFQSGPCDAFGMGWNIPYGTVTEIGVIPKANYKKEKFLSVDKFEVQDVNAGFVYYTNSTAGFSVETLNDIVTSLEYGPMAKEDHRRCPRSQVCCADPFPLFDEYEKPSFEDEKARLANLLIAMNERLSRSVIVVYGRNPQERARRLKRTRRAMRDLVRKHALESRRILFVDGGYRERPVTALNLFSIGGLVSRVYLFPQKDPPRGNKTL